jgi:ABC-type multidrug transport system ATPase subunit
MYPFGMLSAKDIVKHYGAVRGIDLAVAPGQIIGLVGNNGAGKTSVLKMLCGLVEPTSGIVLVEGKDPLHPSVRANMVSCPRIRPVTMT